VRTKLRLIGRIHKVCSADAYQYPQYFSSDKKSGIQRTLTSFLIWWCLMDMIEAQQNIKRYLANVTTLQQVHPQDLTFEEINIITALIKKQNRLINNIEESLQQPGPN